MDVLTGLVTSLLLFLFLGIPLIIIVGGAGWLLVDWLRPKPPGAEVRTAEDEREAMARDLERVDIARAERRTVEERLALAVPVLEPSVMR